MVFRSFRSRQATEEHLSEFSSKVSQFAKAVKLRHSAHTRGEYGYFNFGITHGFGNNKNVKSTPLLLSKRLMFKLYIPRCQRGLRLTNVIRKRRRPCCCRRSLKRSCKPNPPLQGPTLKRQALTFILLSQEAVKLVNEWFPEIAERARRCEKHWQTFCKNEDLRMDFGLWWIATVNFPTRGSAKSRLHRDWKNVAAGLCAIWVFGVLVPKAEEKQADPQE